jgi:hypothetical protein
MRLDADGSGGRSGSVSNHFQFGGFIHCGKKLVNAGHGHLLQFGITTLAALQYRKRPEDHNRRVPDLER